MEKITHVIVNPLKSLNLLSREDVDGLTSSGGDLLALFRHCALAILNTDSVKDDAEELLTDYADFDVRLIPQPRGLRLELFNAPPQSFVDGKMIRGIQEHLFSALRDIVYTDFKITAAQPKLPSSAQITDTVFRILRNARVVRPDQSPQIVVCWGGHSIPRQEYDYAKHIGYQLGLRGLDIVTGCGIGAMKGPMKGAAVGHAKQHIKSGRYIGISEPGIIASESPNAIVNELVISPDLQEPFVPTHDAMAALQLDAHLPKHELASALRRVFSGLVAGNVKAFGIEQVRLHGPYQLSGDKKFLSSMDRLLQMLVRQKRMKLDQEKYQPCYQLVE